MSNRQDIFVAFRLIHWNWNNLEKKFQFGKYHGFISAKQDSRASSCIPYSSFISADLKFGDLYVQRYSINLRGIKE